MERKRKEGLVVLDGEEKEGEFRMERRRKGNVD